MTSSRKSGMLAMLLALGCSNAQPTTELPPAAGGSGSAGGSGGTNPGAGGMHAAGSSGTGLSSGAAGFAAAGASARGGAAGASGAAAAGRSGASSGGAAGAGAGQATFAAVAAIMANRCGAPLCHGGGAPAQGLNFTNMATLYGTLTTKVVAECQNEILVVPGNPTNSALPKLPTWACSDPVAGPFVMPQGCIDPDYCIPKEEVDTFTAWIAAGAKGP